MNDAHGAAPEGLLAGTSGGAENNGNVATIAIGARDRHRPQTRQEMRAAVHELAARGLSDHTVAAATRLSIEIVRQTLGEVAHGRESAAT